MHPRKKIELSRSAKARQQEFGIKMPLAENELYSVWPVSDEVTDA